MDIATIVGSAGVLGTAAMGVVELFKSTRLPPIGFWRLERDLRWAEGPLTVAYGRDYLPLLKSLYRNGRSNGELPRILRQGLRVGLTADNAEALEQQLSHNPQGLLQPVAAKSAAGQLLADDERNILGRFELAVDARIDAALSLSERAYVNGLRWRATLVSMGLALAAYLWVIPPEQTTANGLAPALLIGLLAVPIAPIAKDIAKGLQAATSALSKP